MTIAPFPTGTTSTPAGTAAERRAAGRGEGWAWVAATQAGDRDAFGLLYARYAPQVRSYIWSKLAARRIDRDTVEDLVSQTFCNALRAIHQVGEREDEDSDVMAWLATIAMRLVLGHLGQAYVRHEVQAAEHVFDGDRPTGGVSAFGNPEREVLDKFDREAISQAVRAGIEQLNPPQQECVRVRYLAELPIPDAARVLGRTERAVVALSARARAELAAILAPTAAPAPCPYTARFEPGQWYRVRTIAERTGLCVSTLHRAVASGQLPAVSVGAGKGMLLILGEAITAWLATTAPAAATRAGYAVAVQRARTAYTRTLRTAPIRPARTHHTQPTAEPMRHESEAA